MTAQPATCNLQRATCHGQGAILVCLSANESMDHQTLSVQYMYNMLECGWKIALTQKHSMYEKSKKNRRKGMA